MRLSILGRCGTVLFVGATGCTQILGLGGDFKGTGGATSTSSGSTGGPSSGSTPTTTSATGVTGSSSSTGGLNASCSTNNIVYDLVSGPTTHGVGDRELVMAGQVSAGHKMAYVVTAISGSTGTDLAITSYDGNSIRGTVHYVGLNGGIDLGAATTTATTLSIYMRVNNTIGVLTVPTDNNGAQDPGMYPNNLTSFPPPCGSANLNDFIMQKPLDVAAPRYAARCNDQTAHTDALVVGGQTGTPATIATAAENSADVRANDFIRVGNSDVIFSSEDPTQGAFVRTGDATTLGTANKIDVEANPARLSLYFNAIPNPAAGTAKIFLATLTPPPTFIPATLYRVDVTEATLSQLWQSPIQAKTTIETLTTAEDLVRWDPLVQQGTGYFGAGADINGKTAKLTWLSQNGDILVKNYTVAAPSNAAVGTARAQPFDIGTIFVVWSENTATDTKVRGAKVLCIGG